LNRVACVIGVAAAAAACTDSASAQLGLGDLAQVPGAQYVPGAFPRPTGGPTTVQVVPQYATTLIGGATPEVIDGLLPSSATAALVGVAGLDGAWVVTASFPGIENPNNPTISPTLQLAEDFPIGPFDVLVASVDLDNHIGPAVHATVIATPVAPPAGRLVVSLVWTTAADLDLHVIDPSGHEAWAGSPNTITPAGPGQTPLPPSAYYDGGILDHDANMNCTRDGNPHEDVIWQAPPPAGTYTVRVDTPSLCGAPDTFWYVAAYSGSGAIITAAKGVSTPDDVAYEPHYAGGGITALTFSQ
jgi:hypothetical protein